MIQATGAPSAAYASSLIRPVATKGSSDAEAGSPAQLTGNVTSSTDAPAAFDFTHMTPREMKRAAQGLFDAGRIDFVQLFMLENAGVPLGQATADGRFVLYSPEERDAFADTPLNYLQIGRNAMQFLEQTGQAKDPRSGYQQWKGILAVLKESSAGVNLYA